MANMTLTQVADQLEAMDQWCNKFIDGIPLSPDGKTIPELAAAIRAIDSRRCRNCKWMNDCAIVETGQYYDTFSCSEWTEKKTD